MARILIMEDALALGTAMAGELAQHGHKVDVALNASEAMADLAAEPYDLLITDIIVRSDDRFIPDGGVSLISQIRRSNPQTLPSPKMPIIAMSGTTRHPGMGDILVTAERLGANASLEKPVDMTALIEIIDRLLA